MGARDNRARALALTLVAVAAGGTTLAWLGGDARYPPASAPDSRPGAAVHAEAKRREEVERRFQQGVAMLHARRYEHAVTALHRLLELEPGMPEAHVNMGYALIGLKRFGAARDFFESATALRPGQVNAYYGLAVALEGLDDLAGALGAMRVYVHRSPPDDPYLRKAQSAVWEWEAALARRREGSAP